MCGICGVVSLNKPSINIEQAKPMTDVIAHRGPDGAGHLFFHTGARHRRDVSFHQNCVDSEFKNDHSDLPVLGSPSVSRLLNGHDYDLYMGHRRLAILDLSELGHQPMGDLTSQIWVSYNGEIYNFQALRKQLEKRGHRFVSNTDTEVIIYAYIEWGMDCVKRFNGMFAFALYDNFKKKCYLVRDRYGIKPLYYYRTPNQTLIFASEVKAILAYLGDDKSRLKLDKKALFEYFTFQNILTNKTLHFGVELLEAGHYMTLDLCEKSIQKTQYWDFNFTQPQTFKDENEYIEELDRLFQQAVKRQLVADVNVGSYLSGGMDSGSITAIASKNLPHLQTFTVGFDLHSSSVLECGFDERSKAEYMSYLFQTEHYQMVLKAGDMKRCLRDFTYHLETPRVGQSYPNFYAAKLASKFVKVVLSGAGGDELFAGYPWRYYRAASHTNFDDYLRQYYTFWQRLLDDQQIKKVFQPIWGVVKNVSTPAIFKSVFKQSKALKTPEDAINHSLYFEAKTFLHGLLVVEDKLSMAHSLETRVPFLDNDLVDFAQHVPVGLKLGRLNQAAQMDENELGKLRKTNDGKLLLRKAMKKYIPNTIHNGAKQGFSAPDGSWFKKESAKFIRSTLLVDHANIYEYLDKTTIQTLVSEHLESRCNRRLLIWSLLNFEKWLSCYG